MSIDARDFESIYTEKGRGVLDRIFGETSEERHAVSLKKPCHEREVVFQVDFQDKRQFKKVLDTLCGWLEENDNFGDLNGLMLY